MSNRLAGKNILVTAAGQGIGRATAVACASEGAVVWATDINEKSLLVLSEERPDIRVRHLDVLDESELHARVAEIGAVDVLINCVGYVHDGTILECSEKEWDDSFNINVKSMYRTCRAVLPPMLKVGKGNIINMGSSVSSIKATENRFAYASSKAAVIGFTKAIARDFVQRGIRCNVICPGTVESPSLFERIAARGDVKRTLDEFIARQPMGRLGHPNEVAALAVYLASDESSFATGQPYIIDGGLTL